MVKKKLTIYGDPVLKFRAEDIGRIDENVEAIVANMLEVMHDHCGCGLAAPQIGISKRVIVVQVHLEETPITLVNPKITFRQGLEEKEEGCLSVPGIAIPLKRADRIRVEGLGLDGKRIELEAEGLAARAFQHEIDHIDGILITDRMAKKELKMLADKLDAIRRGEISPRIN